jgi:hypothetical protein
MYLNPGIVGWLVGPSPRLLFFYMYKVESILIKAMRCLRQKSHRKVHSFG